MHLPARTPAEEAIWVANVKSDLAKRQADPDAKPRGFWRYDGSVASKAKYLETLEPVTGTTISVDGMTVPVGNLYDTEKEAVDSQR